MSVLFISGTDTGVGKTAATGWLARRLISKGRRVITQKLIQTGCVGISEDILTHRKIMGIGILPEDENFTTCPQVLKFPASPHMVCEMEGTHFDAKRACDSTRILSEKYDDVLLEGVGGLLVPLEKNYLCADYAGEQKLPIVIVGTSLLGGINRALLALEVVKSRGLNLAAFVYNTHFPEDLKIVDNTREFLREYLADNFYDAKFLEMGNLDIQENR